MTRGTSQRLSDGVERCADPPQNFDIEEIITHDEYDSPIRLRNDIALIRLSRPANLSGERRRRRSVAH